MFSVRWSIASVICSLLILGLTVPLHADVVVLKDGRKFEGKVERRDGDTIVFDVHRNGSVMRMTLSSDQVQSFTEGDLPAAATRPAAAPVAAPRPATVTPATPGRLVEPQAPPVVEHKTPTYYRIPMRGEVGRGFCAAYLSKSLEDAVKRHPTVVVLEIDSPGGRVAEVDRLLRTIADGKRRVRIVALVKQAISAAAITTLAIDEVYVSQTTVLGAATAFSLDSETGMTKDVSEKMKSIWLTTARSAAEIGKHSPILAEAMVDRSFAVYTTSADGKPVFSRSSTDGSTVYKPEGNLLALTASEAVQCGLASGQAEDYAELRKCLKIDHWTECEGLAAALADYWEKRASAAERDVGVLREHIDAQMALAVSNNPAAFKDYVLVAANGRFTPDSRRKWTDRARKCMAALNRVERDLEQAQKLGEQYPELDIEADVIAVVKERLKGIKAQVQMQPPQ